eukprot:PITA_12689
MQVALSLADQGLIGQFTGLWPSPKTTEQWVNRNWAPLISQSVSSYFLGRGYFLFEFTSREDKDLIFRNRPYFMGPQGLYMNKWTPDFDPAIDVPKAVPVWVRLPNLPVHCWNWDSLKHIGNSLGKFIDRASNKDQYNCAKICVEVDLEEGLPKEIKIKVDSWSHVQILEYEQLPFKCRKCHVYGHFTRNCPTNLESEKGNEEGWNQVRRARANHKGQKQGGPLGKGNLQVNAQRPPTKKAQENKFDLLSQPTEDTPENLDTKEIITLINVYSPVNIREKKDCWDTIKRQADLINLENTIIVGDLNLTLHSTEKRGGSTVRDPAREWAEHLLQDWDLLDIKPSTGKFSWSNKRVGRGHIAARLDRFFIQSSFLLLGIEPRMHILPSSISDHKPVKLELLAHLDLGSIPFRFIPL